MMVGKIFYQPLKTRLRPLARVLAFVLVSPPLSAFASTPIDSEVRNEIQWYAFAAYSEVYEVPPPPHLASMAAHVIEEENWSLDTPVSYHLVNYLLAFEQVDASASSDVIKAVYLSLFDEIAPAIAPNAEPDADTITYAYDDLHRLLTSSITGAANGDNVGRTYTYSAIGNILTASDQGTYLYENTNYANPHAVTKVGTAVYGYDNNGNLTGDGTWTHGWEYDNRLKQSVNGGTTVTYGYDHSGQRVKLVNGSSTTRYANKLYNSDGTKNVKHIYAGNQLIATLENATLQYIHTDHLTGSNVATNNSGSLVQLLDYYPYGSMRIDQTTTFDEQRKNFGHEFDRPTSLTYANARYYKQSVGRFLSEDPVFIAVGAQEKLALIKLLKNPQNLNSYSYSLNNPLRYVDVTGEGAKETLAEKAETSRMVSNLLNVGANLLSDSGHKAASFTMGLISDAMDDFAAAIDPASSNGERAKGIAFTVLNLSPLTEVRGLSAGARVLEVGAAKEGYRSYSAFKYAMGKAGEGREWHHIVEQTVNKLNFSPETLHSLENIMSIPKDLHRQISAHYSRIIPEITGSTELRVRDWLGTQSFEKQLEYGKEILTKFSSNLK